MDYQGTISRGIRAPIIRMGDDLVKITAEDLFVFKNGEIVEKTIGLTEIKSLKGLVEKHI